MTQNGQPTCFGVQWDANAVECRGGLDPNYAHPGNGSNRREMCRWYSQCSAATNNQRIRSAAQVAPPPPPVQPPPLVHPQSLVRPPAPTVAPPQPTTAIVPQPAPQQTRVVHGPPPAQQVAYVGSQPYTQPEHAAMPTMVPMNQVMQGANTGSFLMVPEPEDEEVPWSARLWRNTYRAMGKAAFMTLANFIDYNPIGGHRRS